MSRKAWTPEQRQQLLDLTAEGKLDTEIATELGRSVYSLQAMRAHLRREGFEVPSKPRAETRRMFGKEQRCWGPDDDAVLLEMVAAGDRDAEIGKVLGRTRWAIGSRLKELRLMGVDVPARKVGRPRTCRELYLPPPKPQRKRRPKAERRSAELKLERDQAKADQKMLKDWDATRDEWIADGLARIRQNRIELENSHHKGSR